MMATVTANMCQVGAPLGRHAGKELPAMTMEITARTIAPEPVATASVQSLVLPGIGIVTAIDSKIMPSGIQGQRRMPRLLSVITAVVLLMLALQASSQLHILITLLLAITTGIVSLTSP
jgi:hypothetical protein